MGTVQHLCSPNLRIPQAQIACKSGSSLTVTFVATADEKEIAVLVLYRHV